jgi:fructose/tagatose bisphosphate aldolase
MTSNVQRARELMARSRAEHFAVGAFNVDNQETLLAIARAAQAKHAPALVELSDAEAKMIGLANMRTGPPSSSTSSCCSASVTRST